VKKIMTNSPPGQEKTETSTKPNDRPPLSDAARRALAEAEARRVALTSQAQAPEVGGRGGLDPARYGDWEVKGVASDF
jgi:hypothetical protein